MRWAALAAAAALAGCAEAPAQGSPHAALVAARPTGARCNNGHPCPPPTSSTSSTTTTTSITTTTTTTSTGPTTGQLCTSPYLVLTGPNAGVSDSGYYVHNNLWNASKYPGTTGQTAVCSASSWNHTGTATNTGDGAVKTYPNVHRDYHNWSTGAEPAVSTIPALTGSWAMKAPDVGIYDVAWDIWLNGVPGNREIMIWTQNLRQVPAGSRVATGLRFAGSYSGTWDLWATSTNGYLAFVPAAGAVIPAGKVDLLAMVKYLQSVGRVQSNATMGQVCFGVEIVDTGGNPAVWQLTDFSLT